jgi:aryl-alcohol dehydrogenase-like predicted oxidoreductase
MKLILGTAEFGQAYGEGVRQPPTELEIQNIMALAYKAGISTVDTALLYNCQKIVGTFLPYETQVITKIRPFRKDLYDQCVAELHHPIQTVLYHCDYAPMERIKWAPPCEVGASIYLESQLMDAIKFIPKISVIQAPLNLRETWIVSYMPMLKRLGIKLHVRSVFKRGQLLSGGYTVKECLDFVKKHNVDGIIIGVNSAKELQEILET